MSPEQFCYWLKGKFEDRDAPLSAKEIQSIENHLELVFTKVTPTLDDKHPLKAIDPTFQPPDPFYPYGPIVAC